MPNADDLKGRAKEAVGDLTDNDELKNEGKADRDVGKVKDLADETKGRVRDVVDVLKDKLHHD